MIGHKRLRIALFVLAAWAAVALLAACGDAKKKSTLPATDSGLAADVAGIGTCATCHTVAATEWLNSGHANLGPGGDLNSPGSPTLAQITGCTVNCHDPNGDSARLTAGYTGNTARPVVGCEACHGGGSLHADAGGAGPIGFASLPAGMAGSTPVSAQFNTCTSCHQLLNSSGTGTVASAHDPASSVTPTGSQYAITGTHFAVVPVAYNSASYPIAGYAMDFSSETVCSDCHNPHNNADINKEWAKSAHASTTGNGAWGRNWSVNPTCQRCHTTTGFAAYADALRSGDTTTANGILYGTLSTSPIASTASWKPEMLECKGCHTNNKGALRNPGAYTANYSYSFYTASPVNYSVVSHTYPDLGGSNVCMPCHTGRQSGATIRNLNSGVVTAVTFSSQSLIGNHNFQAGAFMFRAAGYNYSGRNYANPPSYVHDKIGTADAPNTGTNGPCIGCHMSRPNGVGNHLFLPASRDESETTLHSVASEVCYKCHGPNDSAFLGMVNDQKMLYADAQLALQNLLERRGYYKRGTSYYKLRDKKGTALVTNGSATVTGILTSWQTATATSSGATVSTTDYFRNDLDGNYYKIKKIVSDTLLVLDTSTLTLGSSLTTTSVSKYIGATASSSYTIITGATADRIVDWLTKAGSGFVPAAADDTDATGNTTGKNNMGAAFNLNTLSASSNEPAGYVHNRYYAKRLMYDSIDWLDDNQLNYSAGPTLDVICAPGPEQPAWCDGAMGYILPNGVIGISAERP